MNCQEGCLNVDEINGVSGWKNSGVCTLNPKPYTPNPKP